VNDLAGTFAAQVVVDTAVGANDLVAHVGFGWVRTASKCHSGWSASRRWSRQALANRTNRVPFPLARIRAPPAARSCSAVAESTRRARTSNYICPIAPRVGLGSPLERWSTRMTPSCSSWSRPPHPETAPIPSAGAVGGPAMCFPT